MKTAVEMFKEILEEAKYKYHDRDLVFAYVLGASDMAKTVAAIRGENIGEIINLTYDFLHGGY